MKITVPYTIEGWRIEESGSNDEEEWQVEGSGEGRCSAIAVITTHDERGGETASLDASGFLQHKENKGLVLAD